MSGLRAVSLFSGVGGMDLGFERAGIETVLQVEWANLAPEPPDAAMRRLAEAGRTRRML